MVKKGGIDMIKRYYKIGIDIPDNKFVKYSIICIIHSINYNLGGKNEKNIFSNKLFHSVNPA